MNGTVGEKLVEVLALPREDRAFLAHQLIASLDESPESEAEREWHEVIDRRTAEMHGGKVSVRSMEQVLSEIREKLNASHPAS